MNKISPPEPLHSGHDTSGFDCGQAALNEFLQQHALDKQNAMLSRTYIVTNVATAEAVAEDLRTASDARVIGYYTLTHAVVPQTDAPKKLGRGMPSSIPVLLMARFAVDRGFQGQGLGRSLFTDAIRRTWAVMKSGAAPVRFFIVDAKDETAKAFYERFDMIPAPENALRWYLSYKTLRQLFEETSEERISAASSGVFEGECNFFGL